MLRNDWGKEQHKSYAKHACLKLKPWSTHPTTVLDSKYLFVSLSGLAVPGENDEGVSNQQLGDAVTRRSGWALVRFLHKFGSLKTGTDRVFPE